MEVEMCVCVCVSSAELPKVYRACYSIRPLFNPHKSLKFENLQKLPYYSLKNRHLLAFQNEVI